ncbi:hypothetical protein ACQ4PT_024466 [Festuca glaucescens]
MEAVISGILGEFVSRAISFVAEKCREQTTAEEDLQRLCQLLLRISTVVEEAEGRCVENRAMVRQVSTMREQMFRGYYLLDAFRNDLKDEAAMNIRDHCMIKHQNIASCEERSLVVIELLGDVDEGAWKRLLCSAERCMSHGSKIIITSQSKKMVSVGTTEALMLNGLSKEAYWYFFKILVFGSTDPEDHPKLTSIAMEMASEMGGSFMFANVVATLLRENLSVRFWCSVLRHLRVQRKKNFLLLGEFFLEGGRPRYAWSMANTRQGSKDKSFFRLCGDYQKGPASHCEVPKITAVDLVLGTWSTMPRGKFEILSWRSLIPPYYSYVCSCELVLQEVHPDIEP